MGFLLAQNDYGSYQWRTYFGREDQCQVQSSSSGCCPKEEHLHLAASTSNLDSDRNAEKRKNVRGSLAYHTVTDQGIEKPSGTQFQHSHCKFMV